ncbi:putative polysaccharide biosynthesis protein [Fructobacillus durionis]|uniref:Membrane protein involved in the export of O-antigen and teichoic acid n=1 Tax=Fructobacillus durionis TaxID=283737 RepID=A0A1I1E633_9LACO|nr:oligosaccharide flippase family protein [Fructobacillus durionis]SFB82587.1 Membrane protein involved in the export of O-antigen and teichoic acid [Fructobacillus durionis]
MTQKDSNQTHGRVNQTEVDGEYLTAEELLAKLEINLQPKKKSKLAGMFTRKKEKEEDEEIRQLVSRGQYLRDDFDLDEKKTHQWFQKFEQAESNVQQDEKKPLAAQNVKKGGDAQDSEPVSALTAKAEGQKETAEDLASLTADSVEELAEKPSELDTVAQTEAEGQSAEASGNAGADVATTGNSNHNVESSDATEAMSAEEKAAHQKKKDDQALVRGSFWLSLGNIISRLLGAAFILPWLAMLGAAANQANALFSQGYNIYGILLSVATFGFPSAISKVMAQLIAKEDEDGLWSLTKQSLQIGTLLGLFFAVLLYVSAPLLSNGNANVIPVLHSLAPAVFVFPAMSMVRGIFQGHQLMHISALSEIVEQIGRIIYLLIATWIVLGHDSSNWTGAVVQATFAAFIGALFAIAVLAYGWVRYKDLLHPREPVDGSLVYQPKQKSKAKANLLSFLKPDKAQSMVLNILKESWPFVIIGASTNLFLFVDQYTFFPLMKLFFHSSSDSLQVQFALFSANPNKLVMIVISFATSIAATALPILAAKKAAKDGLGLKQQLVATLQLTALVLLPSALGMYAISDVLYKFFYPIDSTAQEGIYLLQFSSLLTIIMALFMLLAFVLQALSHGSIVMKSFGYGLLIKIVTQIPLIYLFQGMGALIATGLGLGWSLYQMIAFLMKHYDLTWSDMKSTLLKGYLASMVMAVVAFLATEFSTKVLLSANSKLGAGLATFIGVAAGGVVLLYLYKKFGLLRQVLNRGRVN